MHLVPMYNIFSDLSITTKKLPLKSSLINLSLYKELSCPLEFRSFSIKYVSNGIERYEVNNQKYNVTSGRYLLANQHSEGGVEIDSKHTVKGICIDVSPSLISEVVGSFSRPDTFIADPQFDHFFSSQDYFINSYSSSVTRAGLLIQQIEHELLSNPFSNREISPELFYRLAEALVQDHIPVYKELKSIPAIKSFTRKELYRKLLIGKSFMDDHFMIIRSIDEVANYCGISNYHFYRLFRSTFSISPFAYLTMKRMELSVKLLQQGNHSVTEIALASGYTGIESFSKSFKRHYGASPTSFLKN